MPPTPGNPRRRVTGQALALVNLLVALAFIIVLYSAIFRELMLLEGRHYSWVASVYWTMQTMTTLGYGDITIDSDTGRIFSMVVLTTGAPKAWNRQLALFRIVGFRGLRASVLFMRLLP